MRPAPKELREQSPADQEFCWLEIRRGGYGGQLTEARAVIYFVHQDAVTGMNQFQPFSVSLPIAQDSNFGGQCLRENVLSLYTRVWLEHMGPG